MRLSFADRVFFANSGAEVNEGAIKLCRRYSREKFGPGRHRIISALNSFHGRTMGALRATGQEKFSKGFEPLLEGFTFVPFNDLEALAGGGGRERLRRAAGAHPGRGRRLPAGRRLFQGRAAVVRREKPAAGAGRGPDRPGPHRPALRPRALRHQARRHDPGQGLGRRPAHGGAPGHRSRWPRPSSPAPTPAPSGPGR